MKMMLARKIVAIKTITVKLGKKMSLKLKMLIIVNQPVKMRMTMMIVVAMMRKMMRMTMMTTVTPTLKR